MFDQLIRGAIWGLGAGLVLSVMRNREAGVRPITKTLMKTFIEANDRVQAMTAEARESLNDMYAEVQVERQNNIADASADTEQSTMSQNPQSEE